MLWSSFYWGSHRVVHTSWFSNKLINIFTTLHIRLPSSHPALCHGRFILWFETRSLFLYQRLIFIFIKLTESILVLGENSMPKFFSHISSLAFLIQLDTWHLLFSLLKFFLCSCCCLSCRSCHILWVELSLTSSSDVWTFSATCTKSLFFLILRLLKVCKESIFWFFKHLFHINKWQALYLSHWWKDVANIS